MCERNDSYQAPAETFEGDVSPKVVQLLLDTPETNASAVEAINNLLNDEVTPLNRPYLEAMGFVDNVNSNGFRS